MKWLIAGLNGTLAPVLARKAAAQSVDVLAWRRDEVPLSSAARTGASASVQAPCARC